MTQRKMFANKTNSQIIFGDSPCNEPNQSMWMETIPNTAPKTPRRESGINFYDVSDIPGTQPRVFRQLHCSKRCTNPVDPVYQLPSYEEKIEPPPKFIRDPMKNDDFPGTSPKKLYSDKPPRDIMKLPEDHKRQLNIVDQRYDVRDINYDGVYYSKRVTNPLVPEYYYCGERLENDFGTTTKPKSKARRFHDWMGTADIDGAQADTASAKYRNFVRKNIDEKGDLLMTPSMKKQDAEIETTKQMYLRRGELIRKCENRHLFEQEYHVDPVQAQLRNQRKVYVRKRSQQPLISNPSNYF